ncbi:hypothetical protein O0I10_007583 [Lichtheimia ornata]|uniref:F-box domain-containing protein n=1 Tax=Lichtheimia ornata TaxID=688661 RepID=A0AAD7XXR3_9FUNG|nr:uncharacterized protein O0I10_007583 [Lichtheimia ornata]KAJ8656736.1 hypothetical protein O0I10_007583 [Lichtheimia ornata]
MLTKRRDFTRVLTTDEINGIFSYLTQHDCMTCMQVSQRWRSLVPQYAETTFSDLRLDGRKDYRRHQSMIACLGPHVKSLVVDGCPDADALYGLMELLRERDCQEGIESLGKDKDKDEDNDRGAKEDFSFILFIELYKCYVPGDLALYLCHWTRLKYLTLSQMTHIIDTEAFYLSLITRCSSLTSFQLQCDFMMMCDTPVEAVPDAAAMNLNTRHLSWNVFGGELEQPNDFEPLLLQCPNLISLEGWLATDFDPKIFAWCPKLQHLRWVGRQPNRHYYQLPRNDQELQALDVNVDDHHEGVGHLKGLSMQHYHLSTLEDQHHLRYLELDVNQEQQSYAIQLLERNATTLQSLLLEIDGILLPIMACLYDSGIIQRLVLFVLFIRPSFFSSSSSSSSIDDDDDDDDDAPTNAALPDLIHGLQKKVSQSTSLEWMALDLLDVFGDFDLEEQKRMLSMIGCIPHLKSIDIEEDTLDPQVLLALFQHAMALQHVVVRCNHLNVTYEVLEVLARLPNIKRLHLHAAGSISAKGVRHLASKKDMTWIVELLESDEQGHACFDDAKEIMKDRFSYHG